MPIYEYKCSCSPDDIVQFERSISEIEPEYGCVSCGSSMIRHYGTFGIQFNGSGFYKTDNPK
jgi:predicted nucleic acid-binding Zn ribbon protein